MASFSSQPQCVKQAFIHDKNIPKHCENSHHKSTSVLYNRIFNIHIKYILAAISHTPETMSNIFIHIKRTELHNYLINTLSADQNGRHFPDDSSKVMFFNENCSYYNPNFTEFWSYGSYFQMSKQVVSPDLGCHMVLLRNNKLTHCGLVAPYGDTGLFLLYLFLQ